MSLNIYYNNYQKPEYTKEEHPMAALYRLVGYNQNLSNHFYVVEQTEKFRNSINDSRRYCEKGPFVKFESKFKSVLKNLELPKKKQAKDQLLNFYPYVPELTLIGNLPRPDKQVYNLGAYIKKLIEFGIDSKQEGEELFDAIFDGLSVKASEEEDIFGMLVSNELKDWFDPNDKQATWSKQEIPIEFNNWNTKGVDCPAKVFISDLKKILDLKKVLTRFQWINMLSGLLRLALPCHLLWIYNNQIQMQVNIIELFDGKKLNSAQKKHSKLTPLILGDNVFVIRNMISNHKKSEMFTELLMKHLSDNKLMKSEINIKNLSDLEKFYNELESFNLSTVSWKDEFFKEFYETLALKSKELSIFGSNLRNRFWFIKHVMEQGNAEEGDHTKEMDQYFWLSKKSNDFYLIPGSGQCIMLTYLSSNSNSYCTVNDLKHHMNRYGISLDNLSNNPIVDNLRQMGLITDSPDSENGLSIHNPLNIK